MGLSQLRHLLFVLSDQLSHFAGAHHFLSRLEICLELAGLVSEPVDAILVLLYLPTIVFLLAVVLPAELLVVTFQPIGLALLVIQLLLVLL